MVDRNIQTMLVVGGGIVGVCNALALQRAGCQVSLIDRGAPGRETSYGNAGVLSESLGRGAEQSGLAEGAPQTSSRPVERASLFAAVRDEAAWLDAALSGPLHTAPLARRRPGAA